MITVASRMNYSLLVLAWLLLAWCIVEGFRFYRTSNAEEDRKKVLDQSLINLYHYFLIWEFLSSSSRIFNSIATKIQVVRWRPDPQTHRSAWLFLTVFEWSTQHNMYRCSSILLLVNWNIWIIYVCVFYAWKWCHTPVRSLVRVLPLLASARGLEMHFDAIRCFETSQDDKAVQIRKMNASRCQDVPRWNSNSRSM